MNTLLRSLIVWLLLLALPYQGMAAAAMAACAPGHGAPAPLQNAVQTQTQTQVQMHDMRDMHDMQRPPCHETAPAQAAGDEESPRLHADGTTCGSCAACGIGAAALPARVPALADQAPANIASSVADGGLPSVHLAQPERPPRPLLV